MKKGVQRIPQNPASNILYILYKGITGGIHKEILTGFCVFFVYSL